MNANVEPALIDSSEERRILDFRPPSDSAMWSFSGGIVTPPYIPPIIPTGVLSWMLLNIPPIGYVLRKKIDHARLMLHSGEHTVTDVAMRLGVSTAQYFVSVFRRYTGQAPSQLRRPVSSDY